MIIVRELFSSIEPVLHAPEAVIVTGMRRVGKTTLLLYIRERLGSDNTLFLDVENPAHQRYFDEPDYDRIFDTFKVLGLKSKKKSYVFIDEIQFARNIPSVVKYLSDHHKVKFFLTGSSSFYLRNLFSESLAGRKYLFELYPLSFREFLLMKGAPVNMDELGEITETVFSVLDRYYEEFILYGGFPGVAAKDSIEEKKMMLDDIFSSYYHLEVRQLAEFRKTSVVRDLLMLLMERTGAQLDISKLSSELGVARETLAGYLSFLEHTYFISLVRPFTLNRDSEIRKRPKFYCCDTGLVNHFSRASRGALFENAVYLALRLRGDVKFHQKKSGGEIDFILNGTLALEVKTTAVRADVTRLGRMAEAIGIRDCSVVAGKPSRLEGVTYGFML